MKIFQILFTNQEILCIIFNWKDMIIFVLGGFYKWHFWTELKKEQRQIKKL